MRWKRQIWTIKWYLLFRRFVSDLIQLINTSLVRNVFILSNDIYSLFVEIFTLENNFALLSSIENIFAKYPCIETFCTFVVLLKFKSVSTFPRVKKNLTSTSKIIYNPFTVINHFPRLVLKFRKPKNSRKLVKVYISEVL